LRLVTGAAPLIAQHQKIEVNHDSIVTNTPIFVNWSRVQKVEIERSLILQIDGLDAVC